MHQNPNLVDLNRSRSWCCCMAFGNNIQGFYFRMTFQHADCTCLVVVVEYWSTWARLVLCLSEVEKLDLQLRIVSGRLVLGFFWERVIPFQIASHAPSLYRYIPSVCPCLSQSVVEFRIRMVMLLDEGIPALASSILIKIWSRKYAKAYHNILGEKYRDSKIEYIALSSQSCVDGDKRRGQTSGDEVKSTGWQSSPGTVKVLVQLW